MSSITDLVVGQTILGFTVSYGFSRIRHWWRGTTTTRSYYEEVQYHLLNGFVFAASILSLLPIHPSPQPVRLHGDINITNYDVARLWRELRAFEAPKTDPQ
jgi:hypothetical protein